MRCESGFSFEVMWSAMVVAVVASACGGGLGACCWRALYEDGVVEVVKYKSQGS